MVKKNCRNHHENNQAQKNEAKPYINGRVQALYLSYT
jgi:hypothetical protein